MNKHLILILLLVPLLWTCTRQPDESPNILWITFEDTSLFELGLYGNKLVPTPNVERLARNGVVFNNVSSLAPHCSPARSSIISGSPATRYGNDWHRCEHLVPEEIYFFPRLMREAGYFCTNNSKTDYNTLKEQWEAVKGKVWDECSTRASYNSPDRQPGQPFFSIFNSIISHQGRIATVNSSMRSNREIDPSAVELPPYVPDLPEMRDDFAWHYESVKMVDTWLGMILDDLEEKGLADNTIIFFYSDHGGPMPQGKEFPFEAGFRVPFVVHVPEKWQHLSPFEPGSRTDRLVDFSDLGPTALSLAGVAPPEYMDGEPFLGKMATKPKKYQHSFRTNSHVHFDPSRTVYDGQYKYIRYYTPHHPHGVWQWYNAQMPSLKAWTRYWMEGKANEIESRHFVEKPVEMLFDLKNDPWEVNNLAGLPRFNEKLAELRKENEAWIRKTGDLGFFPYFLRFKSDSLSLNEWVRETDYDLDALISAAEKAGEGKPENIPFLESCLKSEKPEMRFWGASGLGLIGKHQTGLPIPASLKAAIHDQNPVVAAAAGEALCFWGEEAKAIPAMMKLVEKGHPDVLTSILTLLYDGRCRDELMKHEDTFREAMVYCMTDEYTVYPYKIDFYYTTKFVLLMLGEGSWEDYYEEAQIAACLKTHRQRHEQIRTNINFP
jgi:arylsulfatase A-like enzyme